MRQGIDDDVFQVGAVTLAKIHLHSGNDIGDMAKALWRDYERRYDDPAAVADLIQAGTAIVAYLRDQICHPHAAAVAHHAQFYCKNYDDDGNKRNRGLFRAIFAPAVRKLRGDRVSRLIFKVRRYQVSLDAGLGVPEAPDGWAL